MSFKLVLFICLCLGYVSLIINPVPARAYAYEVIPCCDFCQKVNNPENYNTSYLKNFNLLVKGKESWLFRSEKELTTEFGPEYQARLRLHEFARRLRFHGSQLVMILPPTRGLVHPDKIPDNYHFDFATASRNYRNMIADLRVMDIVVPDLSPLLGEPPSDKEYYFRRDHHWTPFGAMRTAKLVAEEIKRDPLYSTLDKQKFESKQIGLMRKDGSLQVAWYRICDTRFANQYVPEFTTEHAISSGASLDEDALFGDSEADMPPVTLVGTSFSKGAAEYNFSGFLKEYLELDVLNEAMAGGSYDGALIQYLPSEEFQNNPPKYLLWEVPSYHRLNSEMFYRQLNAYLENGCVNKDVDFQETKTIDKPVNEILFNGDNHYKEFRGKGRIVDVRFSSPEVKEFKAEIWYTNGRREKLKIEHAKRVYNDGRFVFFLKEEDSWDEYNFLAIKLHVKDEIAVMDEPYTVTTRACRSTFI